MSTWMRIPFWTTSTLRRTSLVETTQHPTKRQHNPHHNYRVAPRLGRLSMILLKGWITWLLSWRRSKGTNRCSFGSLEHTLASPSMIIPSINHRHFGSSQVLNPREEIVRPRLVLYHLPFYFIGLLEMIKGSVNVLYGY